jgi:long-chain acyl-CoA synthetase
MKTIYEVLCESTKKNPSGIIIDFLNYKLNYNEFLDLVDTRASNLASIGVKPGDVITICLPNIPEAIILFYAINKIGAVSNFIHPHIPVKSYIEICANIKPKLLFILDRFTDKIIEFKKMNIFDAIYPVSVSKHMKGLTKIYTSLNELTCRLRSNCSQLPNINNNSYKHQWEDETAVILISGGTTSTGKAIALSNKNVNRCAYFTGSNQADHNMKDKMLAVLPLFHGYGLISCVHTTISQSKELVLLPYYQDKLFAKTFKRTRPNYINGIPKLYKRMTPILEEMEMDFDFFKGLYCGGSRLDPSIRETFDQMIINKKSNVKIQEGYGLTEMCGAVSLMPLNETRVGSVGKAFDGIEVSIVDQHNNQVKNYEEGTICFKSDSVMKGYLNEIEQPFILDNERWLKTSDRGYLDDEGYIYYCGRIDRVMKISGYEVHPNTVEKVVNLCKGVVNSCAIPVSIFGINYVKVFIESNDLCDKQEIIKQCQLYLPKWAVPKVIEKIDSIPQTMYQKNDYKKLIALEKAR